MFLMEHEKMSVIFRTSSFIFSNDFKQTETLE